MNRSTQLTPTEIGFGRWNRAGETGTRSHDELLQFAEENLTNKSSKKAKKIHVGERDSSELQPGRWIWRMNPRESKRLLDYSPWVGPYQIEGRAGNSLEVKIPGKPNEIINISMVKLWRNDSNAYEGF